MAYGVVRTDLIHGTDVRGELVSLRYIVDSEETAIENGNVVKIGGLLDVGTTTAPEFEREIREASTPAANDELRDIALVATPELMYDERKKNLDEFINEAGKNIRGYRLHSGDIFSVTKAALDGVASPVVGNIVELKAGTKLNVAASATTGSTGVGKIIAIETAGRYTYYVIEVGTVSGVSAS